MKMVSLTQIPGEGVSHDPAIRKQVIFRRGELPHIRNFSRAVLTPGQRAKAHSHEDMFEVFYVENGRGRLTVSDTTHLLEAGVSFYVSPHEMHEIANDSAEDLVLLYFAVDAA